jgi:precorrin-6A/cobalt-precorrin-6A reductase
MPAKRILVLGGTSEARDAADALKILGHHVVFSLAGVTQQPLVPNVILRRGGFGGVAGLAEYLLSEGIDVVLDATHPFAAIMSRQAFEACIETGVALVRLERPAWTKEPEDTWIDVETIADAAAVLPFGARVLLTTGRKQIEPFTVRADLSGLIRTIEPPAATLPPQWLLVQDRPPYGLDSEMAVINTHHITHIVSKNAGSLATVAKIEAARQLGLPVVMVRRPSKPQCLHYSDVQSLIERQTQWLGSLTARP